ncbi:MAG: polysaccharide biosynthesis/export family protein [Planctomycetota bacterium]
MFRSIGKAGVLATSVGLISCGCVSTATVAKSVNLPAQKEETVADVTDPDYRVGTGDQLTIRKLGDDTPQPIAVEGDGCIHLANATLRVDGLTTGEIATSLRQEFGWEFQNCSVRVEDANSQVVHLFVPGEPVQAIPYRGKETVEDLLARSDCASCRRGYRVRVVRPGKTIHAVPEIFAFQLDAELKDRPSGAEPVVLQPNDYVYLEKDKGKPGELTRMTESKWYQKPGQWARELKRTRNDHSVARRPE